VLVALQRTGEDRPLLPAAEHVVALLRSWGPGPEHLTGLALAGITLPTRLGLRSVDALVFTRCGVVVIAAHEPGPVSWPGPGDRTGAAVAAARGALAGHEGGRHVTGLVAVVPPMEARNGWGPSSSVAAAPVGVPQASGPEVAGSVEGSPGAGSVPVPPASNSELARHAREPDPGPRQSGGGAGDQQPSAEASRAQQGFRSGPPAVHWPDPPPVPGVAVVLADRRGLRRIIAQHNRWRTVWSADDVLDACYALSLAHLAPPRAALIADGFPARLPVLDRLPELPAVIPVLPQPPPPPLPPAAEDDSIPWTPTGRGLVFPRQRPIRQVPWGLLFVLVVLVTAGVVAAVFVNQVFHGS
jgi:hypothetical protein